MFSKRDRETAPTIDNPRDRGMPSIIGGDLHVLGDLRADGEIQIDGIVEGDVSGNALTVGKNAQVIGDVDADDVVVHGTVVGSIRARRVQIAAVAKVAGDIWHDNLTVEDGARLDGRIRRGEGPRKVNKKKRRRRAEPAVDDDGENSPMVWHRQRQTVGRGP